jgi:cellulose synthase/poly-beta-1,6-N-acetylglucosamine synthase-like glycosyltransferase
VSDALDLLAGWLAPVLGGGLAGFVHVFWYFSVFEAPRLALSDALVVRRRLRLRGESGRPCGVAYSVVMPVLNEADTVAASVESLERQSHPPRRIVLVNDGSIDATSAVCRALAGRSPRVLYLDHAERSGKSAALNRGLRHACTEAVVFVDSDTTFDRDAMRNLVRRLERPEVVAVGGVLRVRNRHENLLTELQALEYGMVVALARQAKAEARLLPIISGAFGAFRTSAVRAVGGHDPGPGNDSDLTLDLRRGGGEIEFAHDAVCHTNVPATLRGFVRQRLRWSRNVVKNRLRKHVRVFSPFGRDFSWRNLASTLDPILYQVALGWLWAAYVLWAAVTFTGILPGILLGNWLLYLASATVQQALALALSERRREDLLGLLFLPLYHPYRVFHRLVMLAAQVQEVFLRSSLRDPFAPPKVRRVMPDW